MGSVNVGVAFPGRASVERRRRRRRRSGSVPETQLKVIQGFVAPECEVDFGF